MSRKLVLGSENNEPQSEEDILTAADWELLTQGAKSKKLDKSGESLRLGQLAESDRQPQRLYQV